MISAICPAYNEEHHIEALLKFFVHALPANKELIVIDGASTDSTRQVVARFAAQHPCIVLLDNPRRYVPYALNLAIPVCRGDVIVRLDAHTMYADDYFERILQVFERTGADIVGGPMRARGKTSFQEAVARCTSMPLGVGDSRFHDEKAEGYTDSVYLGAWKKSIFQKTGMFDEEMKRNQDDEFHYRARSKGCSIYLDPSIRSWYSPRDSAGKLFRQYYQYGLYKPTVLRKVRAGLRLRHLVPSAFVLYLAGLPLACTLAGAWSLLPLALYFLLVAVQVFRAGPSFQVRLLYFLIFPILHLSYGLGFLAGLFRRKQN